MGFPLSNAAVRPLTEEELKAASDTLVARAASAGRVSTGKIASQLTVATGEWVPAFLATVQTLMEVRSAKLEPVTRPFIEGMELPAVPGPVKDPFDVWSVPVERKPGAPAQKTTIPITSTLQKKDCQACLGKGAAPCKACFAKGSVNCEICMGAGSQPCGICKGQGKISCPDCEGTGRTKGTGPGGRAACGSCGGAGKFNCTHCVGGKVDCAACGNAGKKNCPACEGKGRMECGACGGSMKVVVGMGFQVDFRPQQSQSVFMGVPGPNTAQEMALAQKSAPVAFDFPSEEAFRSALKTADVPEGFRGGAEQLLARVRPPNASARLGALKFSVAQGAVWRVTGAFSGHEFVYWIQPSSKTVFAEKDPLLDANRQSVSSAQEALKRGDWEVAVDSARQALALDPHHPEAREIAASWRKKLGREMFLIGAAAGAAGAAVAILPIFAAQKGLHRMGPALMAGAAEVVVGLTVAAALLPVAKHLFPAKKRLTAMLGACGGAVVFFFVFTKAVLGWNPVKSADQKALDQEMAGKFKYGVSKMYHEPDLAALQDLYKKYEHSQADLSHLNEYLESQLVLKNGMEALTKEFREKLDQALYSTAFLPEKRSKIAELKEHYALRGVDVAPAEAALQKLDGQIKAASVPSRTRTPGKISITPVKSSSKKSAARRAPPPAKKVATKAKPVVKKKKITPNKDLTVKKKKTRSALN